MESATQHRKQYTYTIDEKWMVEKWRVERDILIEVPTELCPLAFFKERFPWGVRRAKEGSLSHEKLTNFLEEWHIKPRVYAKSHNAKWYRGNHYHIVEDDLMAKATFD